MKIKLINGLNMAKTTYKTRAKAAEHLNTLDPSKTVVQWHTFLNESPKSKGGKFSEVVVEHLLAY